MTDKEIALNLSRSRWHALMVIHSDNPEAHARVSVNLIHHIINSINWED